MLAAETIDQRKDRSMRREQRCRSNWGRRAGARPVCGPFEREEAVDRAAAVPPSRSKCIIVYNDRKQRERLCDGCEKVISAQWLDLNLHVEKTITLNDAFPVEHRVNTFVQHARQSSRTCSTNYVWPRVCRGSSMFPKKHRDFINGIVFNPRENEEWRI